MCTRVYTKEVVFVLTLFIVIFLLFQAWNQGDSNPKMEVCLIITDTLFKKIYMYLFFKGREERWKNREKREGKAVGVEDH